MTSDGLDEGLFEHLIVEFLDHGKRAVEFLRTSTQLLGMSPESLPQQPALVANCLREAMKAIPASQDTGGSGEWSQRSREVVDAKRRFELVRGLPGEDGEGALGELLAKVEDMALTHEQDRIHQQRLIAVIVNRTGARPLTSGTDPVRTYQDLIDRCDKAVHGTVTLEEAKQLWIDCLAVLRQLFMPPDVRHRELDALADLDNPGSDDAQAVLSLVAGPNHLQRFLSGVKTSAWFELLDESGVLEPPAGQGAWPVFAAVDRLKKADPTGVAVALSRMLNRWGADAQRAWYIARAAIDLGPHGRDVILAALRRHPASSGLIHLAIVAAGQSDPADEFVESVADLALNQTANILGPVEPLVRSLADGVTAANYASRIRILCFKLRAVRADDRSRRFLAVDRGGSIEDRAGYFRDDHFAILLPALVRCLRRALEIVDMVDVLESIESLPDDLGDRVRAWALGHGARVDVAMLIGEVRRAVTTRLPTGDDLRLVEKITSEADPSDYVEEWTQAIPAPPSAAELGAALAARDVPDEWVRVLEWSGLLPAEVTANWSAAIAILSASYGEPSKTGLQRRMQVEFGTGQSPLSEDEIRAMPVEDAARQIAAWRPDPNNWLVSARELGRTLEAVVKPDPTSWASQPLKIVGLLHHPTYIHHYLAGLASADTLAGVPIDDLLDAIVFVRAHPWTATRLGDDSFDFDADWRGSEGASVDLIKALAASDVGFADRREGAWSILRSEVDRHEEPSGFTNGGSDPLQSAINRPGTRALEAVLAFMGHEFRVDQAVRPEALDLLASVLELTDGDGAQHRAILAPRIGFLRHIAPEWVDRHREQLFGDAAADGLGQLTIDLALKWGQPNRWLLEQFPRQVRDAVGRDVENALEQYLVAMVRDMPGYRASDAVGFLSSLSKLSVAGEALGRLLRADDATGTAATIATEFWSQALEANTTEDLAGFGWFSEISVLDETVWADLTLRTLMANHGRIDWAHKVAERASSIPPTPTTLAILNELVRGLADEWDRRQIAETAVGVLNEATALADTPEYQRLRTTLLERGLL